MKLFVPTRIDVYVGTIAVIGLVIIVSSLLALPFTPNTTAWLALGLLAMVASRFPLRVPGTNAWVSISDTFVITSALLFGPAPATVTMAVDSTLLSTIITSNRRRMLFNSTAPAVALWCGAQTFFWISGATPLYDKPIRAEIVAFPLACFAAVYFVLNSGLTATAIALEKRKSAAAVFRSHFGVVSLNWFAAASAAFVLVQVAQYWSLVAIGVVVPLIAVIHLAMRSWTGRIQDAEQHVATVDKLYLSTIGALSTAIEAKDGVTSSHIHRVQHYAMGLARAIGNLDVQTLKAIEAAALLHDTGKLAVPERILNKPGKLTPAEFETMKLHVDAGADILSSIDFPYPVVPIVRAHHENWDGTGYPNGLKGLDIPIGARILSVVDCYDALTSDRPYRGAMTDQQALVIIRERRGTMYDPVVVDTFERVVRDIGPMAAQPQMQRAIDQINRAATPQELPATVPPVPTVTHSEGPDPLAALANLARIVTGRPSATDLASMIWAHVRHIVPNASCAFFLNEPARDAVAVKFVAGEASAVLQGLEITVGDRLTGWVAENRQPIVNSEAQLDLGSEAAFVGLRFCVSLPLASEGQLAGVLSLYAKDAFTPEQVEKLHHVLPHLAVMFLAMDKRIETAATASRSQLRVVSSR